jgi:RHS repeat-associated protein
MRFGFQGLRHDEESGLIENRNRMLDPTTGRFMQRDPMGYPDGMNLYAVYHVMWGTVDPTGMWSVQQALYDRILRPFDRAIQRISRSVTGTIEGAAGAIVDAAKSEFTKWKDRAGTKGTWKSDERKRKDFGPYLNVQWGYGYQVTADACCVTVTGFGFLQGELKSPSVWVLNLVGRVNGRLQGSFKYCIDGTSEWEGGFRLSFSGGVQASIGTITKLGGAKATAEVGVGTANFFSFKSQSWSGWDHAVYGRVYAEWKIGWWGDRRRKEFRVSHGGVVGID